MAIARSSLAAADDVCGFVPEAQAIFFRRRHQPRRPPVCTENLIRIDCVTESPNVNGDDRALLPLPDPVRLAVQVEETVAIPPAHNFCLIMRAGLLARFLLTGLGWWGARKRGVPLPCVTSAYTTSSHALQRSVTSLRPTTSTPVHEGLPRLRIPQRRSAFFPERNSPFLGR